MTDAPYQARNTDGSWKVWWNDIPIGQPRLRYEAELLSEALNHRHKDRIMSNAIGVIQPYRACGSWVFDDPAVDLVREPFVAGMPEMIDGLVADIDDAEDGFRLLFSAAPFPGYQRRLDWRRSEDGGNWYGDDSTGLEGWLCPALFKYFPEAPPALYVKAEALK